MGSWNGTCHITGRSIKSGEDVVAFPLVSDAAYRAEWSPTMIPVYGKYNDYGSIEKIQNTPLTDLLLEKINSDVGTYIVLGGDYKETTKFDSIESVFSAMEREACMGETFELKNFGGRLRRVSFLMIRLDTWNWVLDKIGPPIIEDWSTKKKSNLVDDLIKYSEGPSAEKLADAKDKAKDLLDKKKISEEEKSIVDEYKRLERAMIAHECGISQDGSDFKGTLDQVLGTYQCSGAAYVPSVRLYDLDLISDTAKEKHFRKALTDQWAFLRMSFNIRKDPHLPGNSGSQDDNEEFIRDLSEHTFKSCVKDILSYEDEYDEEED